MQSVVSFWQTVKSYSTQPLTQPSPNQAPQKRPRSPVMANPLTNSQVKSGGQTADIPIAEQTRPSITPTDIRNTYVSPSTPAMSNSNSQTHLVLCVNGLFGSPANWRAISKLLREHMDPDTTFIHVSAANQFNQTFDGIDTCGQRLAEEVSRVVAENPHLERLSIVAHSMGGLISRYAIGKLYNPKTKHIAGLYPTHFVALAVPHVGVSKALGVGEVPLIRWMSQVPGIGSGIQRLAQSIAPKVAKMSFSRSGQQFFLEDKDSTGHPLLYRLARDVPHEGLFFSALASFETRTLYANKSGDHLVNFAQSSVRSIDELPDYKTRGRGVVREDPLLSAWPPEVQHKLRQHPAATELHAQESLVSSAADVMKSETPEELVAMDLEEERRNAAAPDGNIVVGNSSISNAMATISGNTSTKNEESQSIQGLNATHAELEANKDAYLEVNLQQLQKLSWRRIDVCFGGAILPLLAHQHLQVQRHWLNWEGMATAKHLALQLAAMEELRTAAGVGPQRD